MTDKCGFLPSCEVTDPNYLFGHKNTGGLLESVTNDLIHGTNIQICGERRSGKTSLLKCSMINIFNRNPYLISIYINFKQHYSLRGYANAHRHIIAHMHSSVISSGHFSNLIPSYEKFNLPSTSSIEELYQFVSEEPDSKIEWLLRSYLDNLNRHGGGIVLLIDEYEHMIYNTFEGKKGAFFFLRELSSTPPPLPGLPKPLTYAIAGALSWDKLCDSIGSPEFNNIGAVLFARPVDLYSFKQMWDQCLYESSEGVRKHLERTAVSCTDVFELSGGWPFYGKVIGKHLSAMRYEEDDFYQSLLPNFSVIWNHLSDKEKEFLIQAADGQLLDANYTITNLIYRGLLMKDDLNNILPCGCLWGRFINDQLLETELTKLNLKYVNVDNIPNTLDTIVDEIINLITDINETTLNMYHEEIFRCTNQDAITYKHLKIPALTRDQFSHFSLSLYNTFFERTIGPKDFPNMADMNNIGTLKRLPKNFRRKRSIIRIIDSIRHHFGKGHLTRLDTFKPPMTIDNVLVRYLKTRANPRDDQFIELQVRILQDAGGFLRELRGCLENMASVGEHNET